MAISENSIKIHCCRSISIVFFMAFFICLFLSCSSGASSVIPSNFQTQRQLLSQTKAHSSRSVSSSSLARVKKCNYFGKCKVQFEGDEHAVPSGPNPISNRPRLRSQLVNELRSK